MEPSNPQRAPAPGTTWLRIAGRTWTMPDAAWEVWVRHGHVPPDALVLSRQWTRGAWRRADSLEVYHLFAPSMVSRDSAAGTGGGSATGGGDAAGNAGAARPAPGHPDGPPPATSLPPRNEPLPAGMRIEVPAAAGRGLPVALTGRGLSVTQALLFANLLISALLVWRWRMAYEANLWAFSGELRARLFDGRLDALLPPLFLHASAQHLLGNMVGLVAGGAAVEEFYGRARTLLLYLAAGLCGAGLSLLRPKEVLSVGASGAVMGLYGVMLVFLLRYRSRFSARQRMKTTRIYLPLLLLALLPGLLQADLFSHVGGFAGGILAALLVPPPATRIPSAGAEARSMPDPGLPPDTGGGR